VAQYFRIFDAGHAAEHEEHEKVPREWRVRLLSDERHARSSSGLPLAQAACGSQRPLPNGALSCTWQQGDFSAHFFPTSCPTARPAQTEQGTFRLCARSDGPVFDAWCRAA
jgi:hypothetical protein